jgi:aspartyl protease family protein
MRSLLLIAIFIIAAGALVAQYADQAINAPRKSAYSDAASPPPQVRTVTAPPPPSASPSSAHVQAPPPLPEIIKMAPSARSVTLKGDGHRFRAEGRIDGVRISFLVDTGATTVALRASTAAKLGIHLSQNDYTVKVQTANGVTNAAPVQLKSVEIGDILVRDVRALVQPDDKLHVDLLGMTFLSRVRWTHDRGRLVIEQ